MKEKEKYPLKMAEQQRENVVRSTAHPVVSNWRRGGHTPADAQFLGKSESRPLMIVNDGVAFKYEKEPSPRRIILLGKTGAGKSSLANIIFGEELFTPNHSVNSGTSECQAKTKSVNGRDVTLIDTPGFFDTVKSEEDSKREIMRCITESSPGPHAFLIVLKVEKFTAQEQDAVTKICQYFSEDALKYAVLVFTHGEELPPEMKIEEFVSQNENLRDLVRKCGSRCHVFDNKYWENKLPTNYRSNQFQVKHLLDVIDIMVMKNSGGYYTNQMLQVVETQIQEEEEHIKLSSENISPAEVRRVAKNSVLHRILIRLAGFATGALLGAFFGIVMEGSAILALVSLAPGMLGKTAAVAAVAGGVIGGVTGYMAAEDAETILEAAEMALKAVRTKRKAALF